MHCLELQGRFSEILKHLLYYSVRIIQCVVVRPIVVFCPDKYSCLLYKGEKCHYEKSTLYKILRTCH